MLSVDLAPQVGLEPTTLRLTAECSAIELLRNKRPHIATKSTTCRARKAFYNKWVPERQGAPIDRSEHYPIDAIAALTRD